VQWQKAAPGERIDGIRYMRVIELMAQSYKVAGDVHGISRDLIPEIREALGERFAAAVLIREPLRRFVSQLAFYEVRGRPQVWDLRYTEQLIARHKIILPHADTYSDRFVVHAANMLNAIVEESAIGTIYRMEDITTNPHALGMLVTEVTQGSVTFPAGWLETMLKSPPANTADRSENFQITAWHVEVLRRVVSPKTWELYAAFGYDQPDVLV
jgi:hypothetical protein